MSPFDALPLQLYALAYLVGGIPFGYIVARARGVDIRRTGSGNIGATNVARTLGRPWGVLVFLLDAGKCFGMMWLARTAATTSSLVNWRVPPGCGWADAPTLSRAWVLAGCGLAAIGGSIAPVYLRFRGGKAVSASVGTVLAIWPDTAVPGLACAILWALTAAATRYVSAASIVAASALPVLYLAAARWLGRPLAETYPLLILSTLLALMVVLRHRANIRRLREGTERKIGQPVDG